MKKLIGKLFQINKWNLITFPLLLALYELAIYLSNDAYLPALPSIVNDLATKHHLVQLTLTAWFFGSASVQLFLGPISNRYGRRPVLLGGGVIFIFSTLICALTSNINILLISRFVQGAAIPSMIVAGYATVHELFDHKKAIHTLSWMLSITVLAPSAGPLFGAVILYFADWRWIFGILVIWSCVVISLLYFKMPETNKNGYKNPISFKLVCGQYMRILLNVNYMKSSLSYCFLFGAMIAWITAGPFLIITEFNYGVFGYGVFQVLIFGSFIAGAHFIKPMMKRYKTTHLIRVGLVISLCGGLLSTLLFKYPHALTCTIISMMLIAGGAGFSSPTLNRTAVESSVEPMDARIAIFSSLMSGFGIIGSTFISTIYNGTLISLSIILVTFSVISFLLKGLDKC